MSFQLGDLPYHTKSVTTIFMPFRGFHKSIISMPFRGFHKTIISMPFRGCSQTFSKHTTINYSLLENPYFINLLVPSRTITNYTQHIAIAFCLIKAFKTKHLLPIHKNLLVPPKITRFMALVEPILHDINNPHHEVIFSTTMMSPTYALHPRLLFPPESE